MSTAEALFPRIDRILIRATLGDHAGEWPAPGTLEEFCVSFAARFPSRSSAPSDAKQSLHVLGAMTELERHAEFDAHCGPVGPRRVAAAWRLAVALTQAGRYRLAASAFVYGAANAYGRAAYCVLLARAGATLTDGGHGRLAEPLLAGALAIESNGLCRPLVRSYIHFQLARRQAARDNFADALFHRDRAASLLADAISSGAVEDVVRVDVVPELKLLKVRILRDRLDATGSGSVDGLETELDAALANQSHALFYSQPFQSHIELLRAEVMRSGDRLLEARACLETLLRGVDHVPPEARRTRRVGLALCVLGEILDDLGEFDSACDKFVAATKVWSEPHYARGLSRAASGHALSLIRQGSRWSDASRRLAEAIAHAKGVGCRGSEARALAVRLGMHRRLGHTAKSIQVEAELARLRASSPDISLVLRRLRDQAEGVGDASEAGGQLARANGSPLGATEAMRRVELLCQAGQQLMLLIAEPGVDTSAYITRVSQLNRCVEPPVRQPFKWKGASPPHASPASEGSVLALSARRVVNRGAFIALRRWARKGPVVLSFEGSASEGDVLVALAGTFDVEAVRVPALRNRRSDIARLGQQFLSDELRSRQATGMTASLSLSTDSWSYLSCFRWPGNDRQLRAVMADLATAICAGHLVPSETAGTGELLLEDVVSRTSRIWALDHANEPIADGPEVLSRALPISGSRLADLCREHGFRTLGELAEHLRLMFGYSGSVASVVRTLNRKKHLRPFLK